MAIDVTPLRKIQIDEEPSGAFAVDRTTSGSFSDMPYREGSESYNPLPGLLPSERVQQRKDGYPLEVQGPLSADLTFTTSIGSVGSANAAGDGVSSSTAAQAGWLKLLKIMLGGLDEGNAGTDVAAATDATDFEVTSAAGFTKGGAFGRIRSGDGRLEAREVGAISGTDLTSRIALSETPSGSDVIYAATTAYPTEDPDTSLQAKVIGANTEDRFLLLGGQLTSLAFELSLGAIPTFTPGFTFADWKRADEAATAFNTGLVPLATFDRYEEIVFHNSEVMVVPVAATARDVLDTPQLSVTSQVAFARAGSPSGVNTYLRHVRKRAAPSFEVQFHVYADEWDTWDAARRNRGRYYFQCQAGSIPGETMLFVLPSCQVINVTPGDVEGLRTALVTMRASNDSDDTSALTRAVARWHFL